jgi:PAS domain S-box-containing protein
VREDWRRAVAEGTHEWSREYRLLTLQGVVRSVHVHVTARLSNDGKPLAYVGTVEDITQSKRAANALRAAQERLHHLVSSSPAVIYSLKVHGDNLVPTFVSENIEQMTGYASQETLTSKWWVEHGDFHSATSDPAAATILREQLFRRKDGTEIWIRDEKRLLHDSSGRLVEVVGSWSDITKRKLGEEELRTSREQLRSLAAHLQSVREEERKRITREIHDELGQSLTGFKMDLAWMRNRLQAKDEPIVVPSLLEKIASMGALVDGTANLVRRLCTELRPGILDDLGLAAAMEWQAREYQSRTGIPCTIRFDLGDLEVDPDRSTALFRIFQEILTNVARHAKATRIEAVIKTVGDFIFLQVNDNGRGITEGEKVGAKSLGLLGMRERAVILGGEVIIEGSPGRGTSITVKVPLPPELAVSVKLINQMGRIPGARPLQKQHKPEGEAIH